jgi:hypothetical protein
VRRWSGSPWPRPGRTAGLVTYAGIAHQRMLIGLGAQANVTGVEPL